MARRGVDQHHRQAERGGDQGGVRPGAGGYLVDAAAGAGQEVHPPGPGSQLAGLGLPRQRARVGGAGRAPVLQGGQRRDHGEGEGGAGGHPGPDRQVGARGHHDPGQVGGGGQGDLGGGLHVVEHVAVVDRGGGAGGGHQPRLVQRRPGDQREGVGAGRAPGGHPRAQRDRRRDRVPAGHPVQRLPGQADPPRYRGRRDLAGARGAGRAHRRVSGSACTQVRQVGEADQSAAACRARQAVMASLSHSSARVESAADPTS